MREKSILAFSKSIEIIWKIKPNFKSLHNFEWCKLKNLALEKDGLLFLQAASKKLFIHENINGF